MKIAVLALFVAVACADRLYAPPARDDSDEVAILRDDRVIEDDGRYNFDMETANGIVMSESGSPGKTEASTVPDPSRTPLLTALTSTSNTWLTRTASSHRVTTSLWLPSSPTRSPTSSSTRSPSPLRRTPATPAEIFHALTVLLVTEALKRFDSSRLSIC
nr:uncharacterized protein LOC113830210 [Penaeus vannamei]